MLPLLLALALTLPPTLSSPSPPHLLDDTFTHLIPRNTLFYRQTTNLQSFADALGGVAASPITNSGDKERPFEVEGDTFPDFATAGQRSCDRQFEGCSRAANGGGKEAGLKVGDCEGQKDKCADAQKSATVTDFSTATASENIGPDLAFPDFDLICDA